ncbi:MAG: hypothetical protein LUD00_09200 [Prevotellaceae bacterium]|nr:hypothetical protein [Prevotellaceae bacterium]
MNIKILSIGCFFAWVAGSAAATRDLSERVTAHISLKIPGNDAVRYSLVLREGESVCQAESELPLLITRKVTPNEEHRRITVKIKALEDIYFNYGEELETGFRHADCMFYMPGFWYRHNLRSPEGAPSLRNSDSWLAREDRLSTPLTAIFDTSVKKAISVIRLDEFDKDALTTHKEGEVILSGKTSIGYTGFVNRVGKSRLAYGFPYKEKPFTYIRKLTLAPAVEAYQLLHKGDSISLMWEVAETIADDFSECVQKLWEYSYDTNLPQPVENPYTTEEIKETLSNFFVESFMDDVKPHYYSGVEMLTNTCDNTYTAEVGFTGRTLLNAFNALEYGESQGRTELAKDANSIFDTYLQDGFTNEGFFREVIRHKRDSRDGVLSIRRQSEGVYACLHYLNYEKRHKRNHPNWETRLRKTLDNILRMQQEDGSFPRKFKGDFSIIDPTGGSTPSATLPLILGYKYFKDKRYLEAAKRSVNYLDRKLIAKADYFSSTLDANCEDKEASLYAATATYYMALVSKGTEYARYASLTKKASYFALSWYYTWDVPFATGQMLGDVGLKSRGWGNVSVENNHIDVFIFEFADVLRWLGKEYGEQRFTDFATVISSSMPQLLPYKGHLCGIAKKGYYPEVVQHTNWDYGRNGKGYYNHIFAPGWTVASLWELYSPGRAESFLKGK